MIGEGVGRVSLVPLSHTTLLAVNSLCVAWCQLQDPEMVCTNHQGAKRDLPVRGGLSKPIQFGEWCPLLPVRFLLALFGNRDEVT